MGLLSCTQYIHYHCCDNMTGFKTDRPYMLVGPVPSITAIGRHWTGDYRKKGSTKKKKAGGAMKRKKVYHKEVAVPLMYVNALLMLY